VVTSVTGYPFSKENWDSTVKRFDELVIAQENQILPIFLLRVDSGNFSVLLSSFNQGDSNIYDDDFEDDGLPRNSKPDLPLIEEISEGVIYEGRLEKIQDDDDDDNHDHEERNIQTDQVIDVSFFEGREFQLNDM